LIHPEFLLEGPEKGELRKPEFLVEGAEKRGVEAARISLGRSHSVGVKKKNAEGRGRIRSSKIDEKMSCKER
jgi:hypothetical protein